MMPSPSFWERLAHWIGQSFLPEFGLFCLALAAIVLPIALVWAGVHWQTRPTTQPHRHPEKTHD